MSDQDVEINEKLDISLNFFLRKNKEKLLFFRSVIDASFILNFCRKQSNIRRIWIIYFEFPVKENLKYVETFVFTFSSEKTLKGGSFCPSYP